MLFIISFFLGCASLPAAAVSPPVLPTVYVDTGAPVPDTGEE